MTFSTFNFCKIHPHFSHWGINIRLWYLSVCMINWWSRYIWMILMQTFASLDRPKYISGPYPQLYIPESCLYHVHVFPKLGKKNKWAVCPLFNSTFSAWMIYGFACIKHTQTHAASPARGEASSCTSCAGWASSWLDTGALPPHLRPLPPSPGRGRPPAWPDCGGRRSACLHLHGDGSFGGF